MINYIIMNNNLENNKENLINDLKNYLLELGFSKKKLNSYKFITVKFLNNLIINEIKKKDKLFRQKFFNEKQKKIKNNTKNNYSNLIDLINNN